MFAFSIPLVQELPVTKEMNKLRKKKKEEIKVLCCTCMNSYKQDFN